MSDFCDTHGLDLPCKRCFEDRLNEFEYLNQMMKNNDITIDDLQQYKNIHIKENKND